MSVPTVNLVNAPLLQNVSIGYHSFTSATELLISNATSIVSLSIKEFSFVNATLFDVEVGGRSNEETSE